MEKGKYQQNLLKGNAMEKRSLRGELKRSPEEKRGVKVTGPQIGGAKGGRSRTLKKKLRNLREEGKELGAGLF